MINKEIIVNETENLIKSTKEKLNNAKSVALNEAWKTLQLTIASVVQILENLATDINGKDKKEFALNFINDFYDKVFVIIDVPFVPSIVEPIIHKYIKNILMIMVSASIDATVTIFKNTGVFIKREAGL
jgi:hypothetical protein